MIRYFAVFFLLLLIPFGFSTAFGSVDDFTTNKSLYHKDDQLTISGSVSYDPEIPFVTIQIFTPGKANFADFNTIPANSDGSFSATFHVGGPTWTSDGVYPIKVTYGGNLEKTIEYQESSTSQSEPEPEPETPESVATFTTLKLIVPNFPALDKASQYYIDKYSNEPSYKSWFDSQFPSKSIYNVLGYEDPVSVPDWIRNNAEWWATGEIPDSTFVTGIEFMLENNIIMISNIPSSQNVSEEEIPEWIRNNGHWWSQNLISEDEFVNSLKYLIQEGIIVIN